MAVSRVTEPLENAHNVNFEKQNPQGVHTAAQSDLFIITDCETSDDARWVRQFVHKLESKHNIRCLYAERDYDVGCYNSENLFKCIKQSKKIVIALSDTFVHSGECKYDMEQAFSTKLEKNDVIVVLIGLTVDKLPLNATRYPILDATDPEFMKHFIETFHSESFFASPGEVCIPVMRTLQNRIKYAKLIPQPGSASTVTDILKDDNHFTLICKMTNLMQCGSWSEVREHKTQLFKQKMESRSDIIVEQFIYLSICSCLNDEFNEADNLLAKGYNMLKWADNENMLKGRLYSIKGYRYVKEGNFNKSSFYLDKALEIFKNFQPYYWHGTTLLYKAYTEYKQGVQEGNETLIEQMEHGLHMLEYTHPALTNHLKQRMLQRMVLILLNCDSPEGRALPLKYASRKLFRADEILKRYYSTCQDPRYTSKYVECHSFLTEACCHYRLGQIEETRELAKCQYILGLKLVEQGERIAIKYRFQSEMQRINSLLGDFRLQLHRSTTDPPEAGILTNPFHIQTCPSSSYRHCEIQNVKQGGHIRQSALRRDTNTALIIFGDQVIRDIDPTKIGKNRECTKIRVSTIAETAQALQDHRSSDVNSVIIHIGSDDVFTNKFAYQIAKNMCEVIEIAKSNFPSADVYISDILPRGDDHMSNWKISSVNFMIREMSARTERVRFITHTRLQNVCFFERDLTHLNKAGTKVLASNIIKALKRARKGVQKK